MDLPCDDYSTSSDILFAYQAGESDDRLSNSSAKNPFLDTFSDPLCRLNLQETSDFVKSFPPGVSHVGSENKGFLEIPFQRSRESGVNLVTAMRNLEAPPTPGRPVFSFSSGNFSRKSFPSKWDDAEKWLIGGHDSPALNPASVKPFQPSKPLSTSKQFHSKPQVEFFAEKSRVITEEKKISNAFPNFHNPAQDMNGISVSLSASADLLLKDKFTHEVKPIIPRIGGMNSLKEGFLLEDSIVKSMHDGTEEMIEDVKHRDIGTEMTPLGSSTTSRCPTPFKSTSPVRHNTPANRSGPLSVVSMDSSKTIDLIQIQDSHLAKLHNGGQYGSMTPNWSSREEEEEDVSKSLRHFEMNIECRRSVSELRSCAWEEEDKAKSCLRYQREEAKIQAWVNLQSARAEAESRKLDVKIQKMRSNLEEKLMKRMGEVHRKAEEWRAAARFQHSDQILRTHQQARKSVTGRENSKFSRGGKSCGCFPCNKYEI